MKTTLSLFAAALSLLALCVQTVRADAVAEVNGVEKSSLSEAFSALNASGGTLKLLTSITSSSTFSYTGSHDAVVDLNGNTVTSSASTSGEALWLTQNSSGTTLTLKNGTFEFSNENCKGVAEVTAGNLLVEDVVCSTGTRYPSVIVGGSGTTTVRRSSFLGSSRKYSGVSVAGGTAIVEDCTIVVKVKDTNGGAAGTWRSCPVRVDSSGNLTIRGGYYKSPDGERVAEILGSGGTVTIESGTFDGSPYMDGATAGKSGNFYIQGGSFTNVQSFSVRSGSSAANFKYHLSGGTFDVQPPQSIVNTGYECHDNGNGSYTVRLAGYDTFEAIIGEHGYTTLAAAFAAVGNGETVRVTKDCNMTGSWTPSVSCTVDFGGNTVTDTGISSTWAIGNDDGSGRSIVLKNGSFISTRTACNGFVRWGGSALTLQDMTISTVGDDFAVVNRGGCLGLIENCDVTGYICSAIDAAADTTTIRGTHAKVTTNHYPNNYSAAIFVANAGVLNVEGSNNAFTGPSGGRSFYVATSGGTINVAGGTFTGGIKLDADQKKVGACTISGGTFTNAEFARRSGWESYNTYTITGGTFDANPSSFVPASGYVVDDSVSDLWTVRPKGAEDAVAKVTVNSVDSYFDTLDQAFAAVSAAGSTVTVLKDCTMTAKFAPSVSCTVDFDGKTVTGAMDDAAAFESVSGVTLALQNGTFASESCSEFVLATAGAITVTQMTADGDIAADDGDIAIDSGYYYCADISAAGLGEIVITGGTYCTDPSDFVPLVGYEVEDNLDTWTVVRTMPASTVAKIVRSDEKLYFDTLDAALVAAQAGDTVEIVADCSIAQTFAPAFACTIDLGGKKVTSALGNNYAFTPSANFTIQNGSFQCDALVKALNGNLTVEDVTATAVTTQTDNPTVWVAGGSGQVNGCAFGGANLKTIAVYASGGPATVSDTTVVIAGGTTADSAALGVAKSQTLTVTGGSYSGAVGGYAIYTMSSGGNVNISGGTFVGTIKSDYNASTYQYTGQANVTISGGDFTQATIVMRDSYNQCTVTGGTFQVNPTTYARTTIPAASGKVAYQQGGVWVVGDKPKRNCPVLMYW